MEGLDENTWNKYDVILPAIPAVPGIGLGSRPPDATLNSKQPHEYSPTTDVEGPGEVQQDSTFHNKLCKIRTTEVVKRSNLKTLFGSFMKNPSLLIQSLSICMMFILMLFAGYSETNAQETYAEKLGFPKGAKVIILHVDDVGMSHDSNMGAIKAMTTGIATSCSVMMPCPWVPEFAAYFKSHPNLDVGLHVTLTSEWKNYRWGPVSGREAVPSLLDDDGYFYSTVDSVAMKSSPSDVEKEIKAQIELARKMGFPLTHLDTHMGTVFATADFMMAYVKLGIEYHIPVMVPAGQDKLLLSSMAQVPPFFSQIQKIGQQLWNAGLPVLDDLHNLSYDWKVPADVATSDKKLQQWRTDKYIESFKKLQPGVTLVIMHCTDPSPNFKYISDSGNLRKADMLAMLDPRLKAYIKKEGIILTTWKELMKRREEVSKQ